MTPASLLLDCGRGAFGRLAKPALKLLRLKVAVSECPEAVTMMIVQVSWVLTQLPLHPEKTELGPG